MRTRPDIGIGAVDIRPEDVEAVAEVLASGRLRQGEVTARFEQAVAERAGVRHAVAVSSGTAALHLTYLALFAPGDEVIVPSFTFVATASMLVAVGAVPLFADVDPATFTLSPEDVRRRITPRSKGIVGVHLFGNACDVEALQVTAAERDLAIVWDAAQAMGTTYRGRDVGALPEAVCHSFYPSKAITTGEGGMVLTDRDDLAERVRLARSHGAPEKYLHLGLGFNYRLTDLQAALGLSQLSRLDTSIERRRRNASTLTAALAGTPGISTPIVPDHAGHSFNQYCILVDPRAAGRDRDGLAAGLLRRGVETAVHYPRPLHDQPLFAWARTSLPVSEDLARRILALPVHPALHQEDVAYVAEAVLQEVGG